MTQNAINNAASILAVDNLTLDGNTLSSTDTNGDIVLAPDGTGTVSVTTAPIVPSGDRADSLGSATNSWDNVYANGLTFDDGTNTMATYVPTTSWTPTIVGSSSAGVGTYSVQTGSYSRIGNVVFLTFPTVIKLSQSEQQADTFPSQSTLNFCQTSVQGLYLLSTVSFKQLNFLTFWSDFI